MVPGEGSPPLLLLFFVHFFARLQEARKGLTVEEPRIYRFGGHTLDPRERRLLAHGVAVPLKPRAFDTLLYLVERAGHLVPKEELLGRLWPDSVVEESTLAKNIWLIRRALAASDGEGAAGEWIETVPRTGYRFLVPVERVAFEREPEAETAGEATAPEPAPVRRLRRGRPSAWPPASSSWRCSGSGAGPSAGRRRPGPWRARP